MLSLAERYRIDGVLEGRQKGRAEGKKEGKAETALKMLKRGFAAEEIADIVDMPVEWVRGLTGQK